MTREQALLKALHAYDKAADKFIAKCADGRAISQETLKDLSDARLSSIAAQKDRT